MVLQLLEMAEIGVSFLDVMSKTFHYNEPLTRFELRDQKLYAA